MKQFLSLGLCVCAALTGWSHADAAVVLNELRVDQSGSDTDEFVEFYSDVGMSLNGLSFLILQDNGSIDGVVDLSGFSIGANDVFLVAENATLPTSGATADLVATLNLENGENSSYLLVDGFSGAQGDDLDTDDDGVFDVTLPWTSLLDGIALIDDEETILTGGPEDINYGPVLGISVVGPDGPFYPGHVFASVDGGGIDSIGGFDPAAPDALDSPGLLNNITAIPEPSFAVVLGLGCCVMGIRRKRR